MKFKSQKEYYDKNKEIILQKAKTKYQLNRVDKLKSVTEYRLKNSDKIKEYKSNYSSVKVKESNKKYYENNKLELNQKQYQRKKLRLANDQLFKLKNNIRCLINKSFKTNGLCKSGKTFDILGCIISEFKEHLESQFEPWMNWGNYGNPKDGVFELNKTWDIDHVIPLNTAITADDVIRLNHYTNLKPLCSYTNRWIKRNK